jgi:hypothetical protein
MKDNSENKYPEPAHRDVYPDQAPSAGPVEHKPTVASQQSQSQKPGEPVRKTSGAKVQGDPILQAIDPSLKAKAEEAEAMLRQRQIDQGELDPEKQPNHKVEPVQLKEGWVLPKPEHIPAPTYWPVVMAAGITFLAFGVVTSLIVSAVGAFLFILALVGWIGDIRNEQKEHDSH